MGKGKPRTSKRVRPAPVDQQLDPATEPAQQPEPATEPAQVAELSASEQEELPIGNVLFQPKAPKQPKQVVEDESSEAEDQEA